MSITGQLAAHARVRPDDPALVHGSERVSWRDLDTAITRLGRGIAERVPHGGSVALDLPNGSACALLFLATAAAGRNALMLEPDWPPALTRQVVQDLRPDLVITTRPDLSRGAHIIPADMAVADLVATLGAPDHGRLPPPAPDSIFYTGFTSGSSGRPKGFRRSHRSWTASFDGAAREFGIGPGDVVFAPGPFSHSTAVYALADALHHGACCVLMRGFQAHAAARLLHRERVTVLYAVPTHLRLLIEAVEAGEAPFTAVRLVLSTGAKWPERLASRLRTVFPAANFAEFYGASELSFVAVARSEEDVPSGSVGRAFPGVTISIRDRAGRRVPTGRTGTVFVESPLVFAGYALGEESLLREGRALSVGDRGFLDARGFLHLTGRVDRMIVTSGRNVQPEGVERVLASCSAVEEAAVIGVPDERRGARLLALVQPVEGSAPSGAELIRHLRAHLPGYMIPRLYAVPPEWPRTRTGKSDVRQLVDLWESGRCRVLA